jgi:hypothetical protein
MPEILRKAAAQVPAIETCGGLSSFLAMGTGFYWGNSSPLKWSAPMDFNSN